ncbi:MAG: universal stress protein, partial [Pseudomonadota bacterium]
MGPILVATDLSPRSDIALRRAAQLAHATGAELHVVHILDEDLPAALLNDQSAAIEAGLTAMIDLEDWPAGVVPRVDVEVGHLARMVPKLVAERKAGLIVMGSHRDRGLADLMGQPTLARLMAAVDVPILVAVSSAGGAAWSKAIVGWDFSPAAKAAAQLAKTLAPDVT